MALTARDVTAYGRLSYAHLFKPHAPNEQADPKYSATLIIPKTDTTTIQRIQQAIQAAVTDGVERRILNQPIDPAHTKYPPLRDGDSMTDSGEQRGPEYANRWFISAKANATRKPFVVDGAMNPVIDEAEVYSGMWVNMAIQFYAYSNSGNKGITAALIGVQKVKDGPRLGGEALKAEDVFQALTPQQSQTPPATGGLGF